MHPAVLAEKYPSKPAYIMSHSSHAVTYKELNETSNQAAQLFRHLGLQRGDHIAILLDNHDRFLQIYLAALHAINHYVLTRDVYKMDHAGMSTNNI